MTEAEWLQAPDPYELVRWLFNGRSAIERQLCLFGVACCRRYWHLLDPPMRSAIEVGERFADGLASHDELHSAADAGTAIINDYQQSGRYRTQERQYNATYAAHYVLGEPIQAARGWYFFPCDDEAVDFAKAAALLRDIFGNPFRPVTLDPAWQTATVTALAEAIYAERAFDRLPILADALDEAGCLSADLLNHCRQPVEHVRGCWAVDLLLGKA